MRLAYRETGGHFKINLEKAIMRIKTVLSFMLGMIGCIGFSLTFGQTATGGVVMARTSGVPVGIGILVVEKRVAELALITELAVVGKTVEELYTTANVTGLAWVGNDRRRIEQAIADAKFIDKPGIPRRVVAIGAGFSNQKLMAGGLLSTCWFAASHCPRGQKATMMTGLGEVVTADFSGVLPGKLQTLAYHGVSKRGWQALKI